MMAILLAVLHRVLGLLPSLRALGRAMVVRDEVASGCLSQRSVVARSEIPYEWMSMAYLLAEHSAPALRCDGGTLDRTVHPIRSLLLRAWFISGGRRLSPVFASTGLPTGRLRRR